MNVTHYFHPQCQKKTKNEEKMRRKTTTKSYTGSFLLFPKSVAADGKICFAERRKNRPEHSAPSLCAVCRKCTTTP